MARFGREKVAYAAEDDAGAGAWLLRRPGYDLGAYRCHYCPAWHIGRWSWRRAPRLTWVQRIELGERAACWAEHPTRITWPARNEEDEGMNAAREELGGGTPVGHVDIHG